MTTTIQKWGNSLALRIPSPLAKDTLIHQGTEVDISVVDGNIVVKTKSRRKYSLARMLKGITRDNLHPEQFSGGPSGREIL